VTRSGGCITSPPTCGGAGVDHAGLGRAALVWMLASLGFGWYADRFGEYQKTYGAIGGVIVALLWLYASGLAISSGRN